MSMGFDDTNNLRDQVIELTLRQHALLRAISAALSSLENDGEEEAEFVRRRSLRDILIRSVLREAIRTCEKTND